MGQRAKRKAGAAGAFNFSSTRAYFDKARREKDRYRNEISLIDRTDHFVNFCVAVSAAVDWFITDVKRVGDRTKTQAAQDAFKGTTVNIARDIGNRFKHGPREDGVDHAEVQTASIIIPANDGNIDLTSAEVALHIEKADIVEVNMEAVATVTAQTLKVRTIDGKEIDAWTVMQTALQQMDSLFSKLYLPA